MRSQEVQADDGEFNLTQRVCSISPLRLSHIERCKGNNACRVSQQQMWSILWPMSIPQKSHHLPVDRTITGASTLVLTAPTIAPQGSQEHFLYTLHSRPLSCVKFVSIAIVPSALSRSATPI